MNSTGLNKLPIDIVVTWVDGGDPKWLSERQRWERKYDNNTPVGANTDIRYKDWGNLKYWFRAVEENMPWVNNIYFVTCGHLPDFLDTDNPRLKVVRHSDYIPEEYLPTFNSNTIEMNLWRLKELSENFVLFNDDLFPLMPIDEGYYFVGDIPGDEAVESPVMPVDVGEITGWACRVKINNLVVLNKHFSKRKVQQQNHEKWFSSEYGNLLERNERLSYWNNFCGFHDPHLANALKKSTMKKIWDAEPDILDAASKNRFRMENDISWFLVRYWQLCEGDFVPRRTLGKSLLLTTDSYRDIAKLIREKREQMVSLNEGFSMEYFEEIRDEINRALEDAFPNKSSFEK